ncbi:hypothetical protein [Bacillus smithii]|uniref:hypothetical protein n=1 Tax=Bacillus smithii TaxID=1479 RepID=UPI002E21E6A7|nr:type I restriction enzyme HsdR N-terminal domain-containing protein [Bacillus smithii]
MIQFEIYWKQQDFSDWNEMDIREEFIAPLLRQLGYGKGTINDVIREKTQKLTNPYHRIGRKKVQVDYIPTIRLKNFWIIEAKPGNINEMSMGDLLQAHLYAIHPEIRARYIVLINGWEIRVYDALTVQSWEDSLLICTPVNAETNFNTLINMIGAKSMLRFARQQILKQIEDSFAVERDEKEVAHFFTQIQQKITSLKQKVHHNAREFEINAWKKEQQEADQHLVQISDNHLLIYMDISSNSQLRTPNEYLRRIIEADESGRTKLVDQLVMRWRGRPHNIFRVHSLYILFELLRQKVKVGTSIYHRGIKESFEELAKKILHIGLQTV